MENLAEKYGEAVAQSYIEPSGASKLPCILIYYLITSRLRILVQQRLLWRIC